jgi:alpha-L-fucosidase
MVCADRSESGEKAMLQAGFESTAARFIAATIICIALVIPVRLAAQDSSSASKPTITDDPATLDQLWQRASSKYDARRNALLKDVDQQAANGPYRPDWQSLGKYQVPDWYKDAKFGIFVHWGVYSVPAFGSEWYPRDMYREGSEEYKHHIATYGPLSKFGYKDFIPMFKAEHFDPNQWAHLFRESGAKYVVPVFEHHDGFAMYDSGLSDWTAAKMGPHRDLAGELAKAVRDAGLHLGASSHRVEHNFFLDEGRKLDSDVNDPKYAAFYGPAHLRIEDEKHSLADDWTYVSDSFLDDWLARDAEIVEKYHPELMWFDWWIGQPDVRRHLLKFTAFYYNQAASRGEVGVINYKYSAMEKQSAVLDIERGQLNNIRDSYWQTDTSVSNDSWGYIENDHFKTPEFIVHQLIDIVSKNGNLLVNVGPRSDGTIPDEVQKVLLDIGSWLKMNGEAIYGTRPWKIYGEGPTKIVEGAFHDTSLSPFTEHDFRFTQKGDAVYAIALAWPASGEVVIKSLGGAALSGKNIEKVSLVGSTSVLEYSQQTDGLHIRVPAQPPGRYAYCFKVLLASKT